MAMVWWILTYLDNWRPAHTLTVLAETNLQAHLFMKWSKHKPARRPVYKRVRGVNVWCGYQYIWDTPNLVEQMQPGNTFEHIFNTGPLIASDHVWYYLFSIGERPFKECQSALFHVLPVEELMPSARVYNTVPQIIPNMASTRLTFDTVWWDDYNFFDPATPDSFNIPVGALYQVGCSFRYSHPPAGGASAQLQRGIAWPFCYHSHPINAPYWAGAGLSMSVLVPLRPGDQIQVSTFHNFGAPVAIMIAPSDSPHFWIRLVGPYPISPP